MIATSSSKMIVWRHLECPVFNEFCTAISLSSCCFTYATAFNLKTLCKDPTLTLHTWLLFCWKSFLQLGPKWQQEFITDTWVLCCDNWKYAWYKLKLWIHTRHFCKKLESLDSYCTTSVRFMFNGSTSVSWVAQSV
jgi:hypothetical protein